MANAIVNLLCGIWSCIKGSLRIILFFGCLIFVVIQLGCVMQLFTYESQHSFIRNTFLDQKITLSDYLYSFALLFIAVLGAYGALYKHHKSLKLFAILVAIVAIFFTISLSYSLMNDNLDKEHDKFIDRMKNYSVQYDWTEGVNHGSHNGQATKAWDMLQGLDCCGIDGPKDWDSKRPDDVSKSEYPTSCCLATFGKLCHKEEIFKEGCLSRIIAIEAITLMLTISYTAFLFLLCIIAYILLIPEASDCISTSSRRGVLPQEYQRFEGSVYVRQPAVAPQYAAQQIQKHSTPPMYPNVNGVEKQGAPSSPPPSYY